MIASVPESGSHLQALIPIIYVGVGLIIPILFKKKASADKCASVALAVTGLMFVAAWALFFQVSGHAHGYMDYFLGHSWSGQRLLANGQPIGIVMRTDLFGALMVLLVTGIGFLSTLYSQKYIPHCVKRFKLKYYYSLILLMLGGLAGICLTGDCFNFYVFLEVASISSYALVAIPGEGESLEAAFKYMLIGALGSLLMVFGIALLFAATGTLNMAAASLQITKIVNAGHGSALANYQHLIYASLGLFIIGLSIKSAFFPTHAWLADAHPAAPASVSALLSGLVVKVTGVFLFIRFVFKVFGLHRNNYGDMLSPLLLMIAALTIIGGSLFAIAQNDLKRMLAYSTVAQMGYMLLGIGLITSAGLQGSIMHMINHGIIKSLLFLCSGAVIYKTGIRDIRQMSRMGYRMPLTMACFTVGALSMVGIPPLNGFMSKFALAEASMEAGMPVLVVVLLCSSLLNAVYYFRVVGISYFSTEHHGKDAHPSDDAPWQMVVPIVILAVCVVLFGLKVGMMREFIKRVVVVLWH